MVDLDSTQAADQWRGDADAIREAIIIWLQLVETFEFFKGAQVEFVVTKCTDPWPREDADLMPASFLWVTVIIRSVYASAPPTCLQRGWDLDVGEFIGPVLELAVKVEDAVNPTALHPNN